MADNINNDKEVIHSNKIIGESGRLELNSHYMEDPVGSYLPVDISHVTLQDKFKSYLSLKGGAMLLRAISDMSIDVGRNYSFSVKGDAQFTYGGNKHEYIKGESTILKGDHSTKARNAAKNLQKTINEIQNKKIETFKNTEGGEVKCPTCTKRMLTDRASVLSAKVLKSVKKYLVPPYMPFDIDKIQKYLNMLIIPFLSRSTNISVLGKSCGNPNCKNGIMKTNDNKFQAANQVASQEIKNKQEQITKYEKDIKPSPSVDNHFDLHIKSGHVKNDAPAYVEGYGGHFETGLDANGGELAVSQKGAMAKAKLPIGVDVTPGGNIYLDASNMFSVNAGSPGIDISTTGHTNINAGSVNVVSTEGGLSLSSPGLTILKGKNILIDGNDRTGDSAIQLDAKSTYAKGKLTVAGDLAVKGLIRMEGGLYTPILITQSTGYMTEPSSPCIPETHSPIWNTPPPLTNGNQATIHNAWCDALYILNTAVNGVDLTLSWLTNAINKAINKTKINLPVDNQNLPTGYAMVYDYITGTPIECWTKSSDGSIGVGQVRPAMIPIFNAPHSHPIISGDHTHRHEGPNMQTYDSKKGLNAATPAPSHVPTAAPAEGSGTKPGPKSMGDSCGGAGAGFGNPNSNASNAVNTRNTNYGVTGDPFDGTNYAQVSTGYNADGSLNPPATFSMENLCD